MTPSRYLRFDPTERDEKGGLFELWHITYSLPRRDHVIDTLIRRFGFSADQAAIIAQDVKHPSEYGRLSTKAIRKLLPHLQRGLMYSEACDEEGYDHSGYKTERPAPGPPAADQAERPAQTRWSSRSSTKW